MHRLHRNVQAPASLQRYHHGRDNWDTLTWEVRREIRAKLCDMQGGRCAYCEAEISIDRSHIEHFRQRGRYPQGTFDWENFFGSCNRSDTCGDHKDKCGPYNPSDLLKPDIDDPDEFLMFDPQGGIHPKAGLTAGNQHRAQETIRILNLLGGGLPYMRHAAAKGYMQNLEIWAEYAANFLEEEWRPIVEQELAQELAFTADLPFATVIRHTLINGCP